MGIPFTPISFLLYPSQQLEAAYQHHNLLLIVLNPYACILQSSIPCHTNSAKKYIADMTLNHSTFQGYAKGSTAVLRWHLKAPLKILCLN